LSACFVRLLFTKNLIADVLLAEKICKVQACGTAVDHPIHHGPASQAASTPSRWQVSVKRPARLAACSCHHGMRGGNIPETNMIVASTVEASGYKAKPFTADAVQNQLTSAGT